MSDLSYFDVGDEDFNSRLNSLKEGRDDGNQTRNKDIEAIQGLGGLMTRTHAKKTKEALNQIHKGVARCTQQHCKCTQHFYKMVILPLSCFSLNW